MPYKKIAQLKTSDQFAEYIDSLDIFLLFDEKLASGCGNPLAQSITLKDGYIIGNRFCAQPMEGWDGSFEGKPTELTLRRWRNFGKSGAKLIWGGEAVAVSHQSRGNPNQLVINDGNLPDFQHLRHELVNAHEDAHDSSEDLFVGLQLTHSGRFSKPDPNNMLKPQILYNNPYLEKKFPIKNDHPLLSDSEIQRIIEDFINAAALAEKAGFQFVDIKHCHGYLGHEFLSAYSRPGPFGGSFANRTRFLREIVNGIRSIAPNLRIGVRISAFDFPPFEKDPETGIGKPVPIEHTDNYWFGYDPNTPSKIDLSEATRFLELVQSLDIELVNITAGSPYYVPHIQRPAYFPPSDGYSPPEDPLIGVARQISATAQLKSRFPDLILVGSAYSYLQEWLPYVAQRIIREKKADFIGLGRTLLSYPTLPLDILNGKRINKKKLCRTFSDCTTAPRAGLASGCYPLDEFYGNRTEAKHLRKIKTEMKQ